MVRYALTPARMRARIAGLWFSATVSLRVYGLV